MKIKINILLLITIIIIGIYSCVPKKESGQFNKMIFNNPPQQVEDSIVSLMQLSSKLPGEFKNIYIGNDGYSLDNLFINDIKIKDIDSVKDYNSLKKYKIFINHSVEEIKRMVKLLHFLEHNYLTGFGRQYHSNLLVCIYNDLLTGRTEDFRLIIYIEDEEYFESWEFLRKYQILDRKGKLILVASRGVKIDTNNIEQ